MRLGKTEGEKWKVREMDTERVREREREKKRERAQFAFLYAKDMCREGRRKGNNAWYKGTLTDLNHMNVHESSG